MKTLPDILRDAMLLLDTKSDDAKRNVGVLIARGHQEPLEVRSQAFQITLFVETLEGARTCIGSKSRGWLGAQWSSWHEHRGWLGGASFDLADVLAADWRIVT